MHPTTHTLKHSASGDKQLTDTSIPARPSSAAETVFAVILAVSLCHFINDVMQSLLAAIYPLLKDSYPPRLLADRPAHPGVPGDRVAAAAARSACTPTSARCPIRCRSAWRRRSSAWSCSPMRTATSMLVLGAVLIGLGSAIFHPESSRVARLASGGRFGLAQSIFQVGGNFGQALGPLLAAFIVVPFGQTSVAWFTARFAGRHHRAVAGGRLVRGASARRATAQAAGADVRRAAQRRKVLTALVVLTILTFTKNIYMRQPVELLHLLRHREVRRLGAELAAHAVLVPRRLGGGAGARRHCSATVSGRRR